MIDAISAFEAPRMSIERAAPICRRGVAEAPFFDERERAALALTDVVTLIGDGHVPRDVWDSARAQFADDELAHLLWAIVAINAWNRIALATRMEPGTYEP